MSTTADQLTCAGVKQISFSKSLSLRASESSGDAVAVMTSGGDSQGMNAALRAVVRTVMYNKMKAYVIRDGYRGLVEGGESCIVKCEWFTVSNILQVGGTVIGTARCKEFMEREGRLRAAENLVKAGINNLVVIGGDGSLTGANLFKEEWKGLLKELVQTGRVCEEEADCCGYLNVVGLVGSIDNDMCGTDMTIGTDTALHRIIEAIDCLTSTAASHQRSFVLEVMGRHCGYLALMSGIAAGADWVLVPEQPPVPGWEEVMCDKIVRGRETGRRHSLVVVAEGAVDVSNNPITSQYLKELLQKKIGHDTRITVLGHVQRGGKPSAYDRAVAARMGAAAALAVVTADGEIDPVMIGVQGNKVVEAPLMDCVKRTRAIDKAMRECKFELALELRGRSFTRNLKMYKRLESSTPRVSSDDSSHVKYRFAVMNIGAPAAGMNSAIRAFVRLMLYKGHTILSVPDGFEGFLHEETLHEFTWEEVDGWGSMGGSNLGTNRTKPTNESLPEIAAKFGEHKIQGLLAIGGFEAYECLNVLQEARKLYTAFRIPLVCIPATVSNNVPGSDLSLGCDTALNMIVQACDTLKQSASASRKRVFVVETMGGYCGYLATMAALAGGADSAYIFEEKSTIANIQKDVSFLVKKFRDGLQRGIILRNENSSVNFTTEFLCQLLSEEGKGMFIVRGNVLGHLQQGERPSPFDRILGIKFASHAVSFMIEQVEKNMKEDGKVRAMSPESACMMGIRSASYRCTPLSELVSNTDFTYRIPKHQWWMSLRPLLSLLARHTDRIFLGETSD